MLATTLKLYLIEQLNWSGSTPARDIFACEERLAWRERESGCWLKRRALPFLRLPPHNCKTSKSTPRNQEEQPRRKRELSDSTTCRIEKGWRQPGSCPIVDSIFPPISSPASLHRNPQDTKRSTTLNCIAKHCITHWLSPTAYTHTQRDSRELILKTEYIVCCRKEESTVWWVAMISWWDITEISWRRRSRYREDQPVADSAARLRAGVGRRERNSRRPVVDTDMTFVKKKLRMDFQDNNFTY